MAKYVTKSLLRLHEYVFLISAFVTIFSPEVKRLPMHSAVRYDKSREMPLVSTCQPHLNKIIIYEIYIEKPHQAKYFL